ncbi:MAG: phytanoyl-CoA dioxygenase family protein [Candidatus Hydrogenedentes bacterium]|nr:phytanoyl-CoA dioxygenase family protein [Candidatus Hydrogenedentota bacterium]
MQISERQCAQFRDLGYLIAPNFLDANELELVRGVCDASVSEIEADMRARGVTEDRINVLGKKYFVLSARKTHPELLPLIFGEKAASVCRATIGDTAYLHNEQFVVKMSDEATSFAWHQDSGYSVYSGGAAEHTPYLTCWIALDDMSEANGTISVLPFERAPSRGLLPHAWDESAHAMVGYGGDDPGDLIEVPAGTLVAFSSFLLHRSGANTTGRPRRSYFVAYTPTLFTHGDPAKGVYSSGDPLLIDGVPQESC